MQEIPPPLHPLVSRLEQARVRWQIQRWLELAFLTMTVAAGVWIFLRIIEFLPVAHPLVNLKNPIALLLLLLGFLVSGVYLWRTRPSLQHMARMAESRLNLKERISTVLEFANKTSSPLQNQMYQALTLDAVGFIAQIEPSRLVRFSIPKQGRFLAGLLLVAGMLYFVPTAKNQNILVGKSSTEETKIAAQLQKLSQVVQQDAERTNDPYLQAEARNLEQLRSQIKQGQLKGEELQQQLGSTLERLGENYSLSPSEENPTKGENSSAPAPAKVSGQSGVKVDSVAAAQQLQQRLEKITRQLQTQRPNSSGQAPAGTPQTSKECIFVEGYECLTPDQLAQLQKGLAQSSNRLRIQGPDGGTPGGSGGKAGKGTQSKLGAKLATPQKTASKQLILPKQSNPSSLRRIQISAPTQTATQIQQTQGSAGQWKSGNEIAMPLGLHSLDTTRRKVVSQYFAQKDE